VALAPLGQSFLHKFAVTLADRQMTLGRRETKVD
jgi:hypothetical protein